MTTYMTTLKVQRPRSQRDEIFHDGRIETISSRNYDYERNGEVQVYSYQVMSGNVLKIYAHKTSMHRGVINYDNLDGGFEVAHFRPNQWDMVRPG